jgi:sarcosine oxidase subunit beta
VSSRPDVVIVGAGLIGCASAYSLARRGLRVTLVESGDLASGASGACDGHICCQSKAPGLHLTLAQRSSLAYETLSEELGEDTGYCRCGSWLIAGTPEELTALARCTPGLPVSVHDADEVRRAEPILGEAVRGGRFCPTDGQTDPWLTTLAFCHAARRLGAHVELGVEVTGIRVNSGHAVGVDTVSGPLTSGAVLLAAGAWTAPLCSGLGIRLPLRPRRGEILVTEPMP